MARLLRTRVKKGLVPDDLIPGLTSNPLTALRQALRTAHDGESGRTCITFGDNSTDVAGGLLIELKKGSVPTSDDVLWMTQVSCSFAASFSVSFSASFSVSISASISAGAH